MACAIAGLGACASRKDRVAEIVELQHQGQFAETIEPLRGLLAEAPVDPELNRLYGESLLRLGQAGSAVWPLRRAVEGRGEDLEAEILLARALLQSGNDDDAIQAASRVLEREPSHPVALELRAQANVGAMHEEAALTDLDRILSMHPEDVAARFLRLIAVLRLKRIDEAAAQLDDLARDLTAAKDADPQLLAQLCVIEASFEGERDRAEPLRSVGKSASRSIRPTHRSWKLRHSTTPMWARAIV
jgi:Flp pilus assembly protein TadD